MQHRGHQRGLIFAIAIAMCKDLRRRMRLPASNSQLYRYIADIVLHELGKRLHLAQLAYLRCSQVRHLLFNVR